MSEGLGEPFEIESVVHLVCPTGDLARNLDDLRTAIARASARSIFWHVAGGQRREPWTEELAPDDFSAWVGTVVQDRLTAERLSYAVQSHRGSPEALRTTLLDTLDRVGDSQRRMHAAPEGGEFPMLSIESVPIPTGFVAYDPQSLDEAMAAVDSGAWFHHVVEEPWLGVGHPQLGEWLRARGATRLAAWYEDLATSGLPLEAMRRRLLQRRRRTALRHRIAENTVHADSETARAAVEGLVRRIRRQKGAP